MITITGSVTWTSASTTPKVVNMNCSAAAMAARKPAAHNIAGETKARRNGCEVTSSIHDVLGEPFAPFGGLLGAQLVIDDDCLLLPLLGGCEHAGNAGNGRIELGI